MSEFIFKPGEKVTFQNCDDGEPCEHILLSFYTAVPKCMEWLTVGIEGAEWWTVQDVITKKPYLCLIYRNQKGCAALWTGKNL